MADALRIAASGMTAGMTWLDIAANDVANANDVARVNGKGFTPSAALLAPAVGGGVTVAAVAAAGTPVVVQAPSDPLADGHGDVAMPDIDLPTQMVDVMLAERMVGLNAAVFGRAVDAYRSAIDVGEEASDGSWSQDG